MMMLIHYAAENGKELLAGFMDYEKAFDYANRANIVSDMIKDGCSSAMVRAVAKMFRTSTYCPKNGRNRISEGIDTDYGVTQGRCSSGNIFSYYVSDMPKAIDPTMTDDFMDPYNIAQLADDTVTFAEARDNLRYKFASLLSYSGSKCQVPNIPKTKYCHFSDRPSLEPIQVNDNVSIGSVDEKGYKYLGMMFYPTKDVDIIITKNFNKRMGNISKFYGWLEVNENTPIENKLMVLDNCVFYSILHGVEMWGDISCIAKKLQSTEMKAVKAILKVKKGTTNDLVLHELRRCSIIAKIKDRQYTFYKKLVDFPDGVAVVKYVMNLCKNTKIIKYYDLLQNDNSAKDIADRAIRVRESTASMCIYYNGFNFNEKSCIYSSYLNDYYRYIITRWRLSNHNLKIETGRYTRIPNDRSSRVCETCNILEDEHHVIFVCPRYTQIRGRYPELVYSGIIATFLNPGYLQVKDTACLLHDIEQERGDYT